MAKRTVQLAIVTTADRPGGPETVLYARDFTAPTFRAASDLAWAYRVTPDFRAIAAPILDANRYATIECRRI